MKKPNLKHLPARRWVRRRAKSLADALARVGAPARAYDAVGVQTIGSGGEPMWPLDLFSDLKGDGKVKR